MHAVSVENEEVCACCTVIFSALCSFKQEKSLQMSPYVLYGMGAINVGFYDRFQALYDPVQCGIKSHQLKYPLK